MNAIAALLTFATTAWIALGAVSVAVATRKRARRHAGRWPSLTVLKPLCGADPSLAENLESFFVQDYPSYELVFGVERADDPAVPVVERLLAEHPRVRARLVVHGHAQGFNPKVRNLRGMIEHAAHDLVVVSDSNVKVPASYLRSMVVELDDPRVGLVTSLFAGRGGGSWGGDLERVQLSGFCAAGAALPTLLGYAAVIGKSMLFSRSELERLGGLSEVADVLAEDFVIGKMFQRAGRRVAIADAVIDNVVGELDLGAFFARQLRWSMLRYRLRPLAFLLEPLTSPLVTLPAAWAVFGPWSLLWMLALLGLRDLGGSLALSGPRHAFAPLFLSVLRELSAIAVWLMTPLQRHVSWRGTRLRITEGTRLVSDG